MKRLLLILLTALCCLSVSAQRRLLEEEFYVGAQGGYMASMVLFNPRVYQVPLQSHLGPTAGLVFRYAGHRVCGLQLELNYMQRGWHEPETEIGTPYDRQMDYIEMPLLTHLYFGRKVRGFFNFGPQIGYLVHESQTNPPYASIWKDNDSSVDGHQYARAEKPFDWGLAAGLGIYYRSKYAGVYQLEARFNYSLGSIFNDSQMDYFALSNHMNLSLTFAYMWQFHPHRR